MSAKKTKAMETVDQETLRGPIIPPPNLNRGPGQGPNVALTEGFTSQGQEKGGQDNGTGVNQLGGDVGAASDAIAIKTTGHSDDALERFMSAYEEAVRRSATGEVLTIFTPIQQTADPTARTNGDQASED